MGPLGLEPLLSLLSPAYTAKLIYENTDQPYDRYTGRSALPVK